MNVNGIVNPK